MALDGNAWTPMGGDPYAGIGGYAMAYDRARGVATVHGGYYSADVNRPVAGLMRWDGELRPCLTGQ